MRKENRMRILFMILAVAALVLGLSAFTGCGRSDEPHADEQHEDSSASNTENHDHNASIAGSGEHNDSAEPKTEEQHTDGDHGAEIEMSAAEAEEVGIEIAAAGPGNIDRTIDLPGEIKLNENHVVHIVPHIGGIVREVHANLGDVVRKGELLAVIESRELADATAEYLASRERLALTGAVHDREEELWTKKISSEQEYLDARQALSEARISHRAAQQKLLALGVSDKTLQEMPAHIESDLTRYEILSPIDGTVIHKEISLGAALEGNSEIFMVADLGTVWIDISVYQKDLAYIREGQPVTILSNGGSKPVAQGTIDYVGPVLEHETRTALARIILSNPDGTLRPGTFVKAHIAVESDEVAVAVPRDALQTIEGETVLFVPTGHGFEAHPVATGRSSHAIVEIVSGFEPGWSYVIKGAFELKAILVTGELDSHAGHGH